MRVLLSKQFKKYKNSNVLNTITYNDVNKKCNKTYALLFLSKNSIRKLIKFNAHDQIIYILSSI
jgi:hypothetical protein